jgi:UrcA family protein
MRLRDRLDSVRAVNHHAIGANAMKSRNVSRPTQVFAPFLLLAFGAGLATAAPLSPVPQSSTVVRFHDLNLAEAQDVATLHARIARAARWVCRDDTSVVDGAKLKHWRECVDKTIARAINDANRPALTAFHRGKTATRRAGG